MQETVSGTRSNVVLYSFLSQCSLELPRHQKLHQWENFLDKDLSTDSGARLAMKMIFSGSLTFDSSTGGVLYTANQCAPWITRELCCAVRSTDYVPRYPSSYKETCVIYNSMSQIRRATPPYSVNSYPVLTSWPRL